MIVDNAKLVSMDGALITFGTRVRILNNTLLDPNCPHVADYYYSERIIRGNRLNCGE
ncbi:unnamed protein product [Heligmosomoides polygyrus]|uniref:Recep_L_domain domain-containing protein n=1 Tax=Heligmosomoides polygyrus TaxID=6339 RepID=A0A183GC60_HELPZ|nr:unnamed protein product [Heligmosomoides polygyrus]